uniref:aspartate:alanine exchanger family transporter n=1 Tax=Vaginimicrobium propionicum TaxID=1871034 RepID=UPI0009711BD5|nr:TrkA C-terminal domain-containing protein [Vaginimicrobium propionicum]
MIEILAANPLLTLFLAVALGTLVGAIPFGPLKFGPAGALFVGLAIGSLDPSLGQGFEIVQSIGLALFVYTIGLAAGSSFFRDLKKQASLLAGTVVLLALFALIVALAAKPMGVGSEMASGLFAGVLTATPALAAAADASDGSTDPAVGYAIAYPLGVIVTMIALTVAAKIPLPANKDATPSANEGLETATVKVENPMRVLDIPGIAEITGRDEGSVRVSYLLHEGKARVANPHDYLSINDLVWVVGLPDGVKTAVDALGHSVSEDLTDSRADVDFRRFTVSNPNMAGRTVAELGIPAQYDSLLTRIRRGDADLLPTAQTTLQLGDRVMVVFPPEREDELARVFGDSERKITEVDFWSVGLGITLGVALGLVSISLGNLGSIALGSAAGPLVVGLILGRLDRTGPIIWTMPNAANLTIRQLGLVLFLAAVGLSSGQAFASVAFSIDGIKVGLTALLLAPILVFFWLLGRQLGLSQARVAGALAGFVGQPALLNHVQTLINDERTESGYSATFALGMIAKILLVQVVLVI